MRITRLVKSIDGYVFVWTVNKAEMTVYGELLSPTSQASTRRHSQEQVQLLQTIHGRERTLAIFVSYINMRKSLLTLWNSEAWRYTGPFTRLNRFKGSFPGLGIATVAFAVYCGYEYMFLNDDHGHGGGHGESHH
jgi:hypothetical protein